MKITEMSWNQVNRYILSICFGLLVLGNFLPNAYAVPATRAEPLLNFRSAGHVLGFRANEFFATNATYVLHVQFIGANKVTPQSDMPVATNTEIVSVLERVTYPNLWNGITLEYATVPNGLVESRYRVEPNADVNAIRLRYNGKVEVNADGTLCTTFETGAINESAPIGWQEINGQRYSVAVAFRTWDDSTVGFQTGVYDPSSPLFIDPALTWSTFLGGAGADYSEAIAVDGSGNIYVAGYSNATWGTPVASLPYKGGYDAFVAKLDSNGNRTWHAFLGSAGTDQGFGIAIDTSGNVYVGGQSTATWGSPVRLFAGSTDTFVAKLSSSGSLIWNTFLGSSGASDLGYNIDVDASGNVYGVGNTNATWGSPKRPYTGANDAFAYKLNTNGVLQWNTFLGGTGNEDARYIAVDGSGNAYVGGQSSVSWGSPLRIFGGGTYDGFVAKLDTDGNLLWNTFQGGGGDDRNPPVLI